MDKFSFLEEKIIEYLNRVREDGLSGKLNNDREWTLKIKSCFAELEDDSNGFGICTSSLNRGYDGEWLFDITGYLNEDVVMSNGDKQSLLKDIPLVVESEWSLKMNDIKYDFEKLLVARAKHRLMICQTVDDNRNGLLEYFKKAVETFELGFSGDRYMIAIYCYEKGFTYHLIIKD